jgi:hypothetical protein
VIQAWPDAEKTLKDILEATVRWGALRSIPSITPAIPSTSSHAPKKRSTDKLKIAKVVKKKRKIKNKKKQPSLRPYLGLR